MTTIRINGYNVSAIDFVWQGHCWECGVSAVVPVQEGDLHVEASAYGETAEEAMGKAISRVDDQLPEKSGRDPK